MPSEVPESQTQAAKLIEKGSLVNQKILQQQSLISLSLNTPKGDCRW